MDRTMQAGTATRGGDQGGLRAFNRRLILGLIRQTGPMAKAEIARVTGLTAQSASVIVNELLAEGLVRKETKVRGKVGQPTTPIALDPDGAFSVGVKIGRRSLEVALVDFLGRTVAARISRHDLPRRREVMPLAAVCIAESLAGLSPSQRARVIGIGVAVPWQLSGWAEVLGPRAVELAEWDHADIGAELAMATGLPCEVWNDATAACAAEMLLGQAITRPATLYIYVGTFVGGGVVIGGRLFEGSRRNAGAIGSIPVEAPGGGHEQLIRQASLVHLERALDEAGFGGSGEMRLRVRQARRHPAWLGWRARAATGLAHAIAAAIAVVDFDGAVIDAMLDREDVAALTAGVRAEFARCDLTGTSPVEIVAGTIGPAARSLGAAILPIVRRFAPDRELLVKRPAGA